MADYNSTYTGKQVDDAVGNTANIGYNLIQDSTNNTYKGNTAYKNRFIDVIDNAALKSDMPKAADDPVDTPKPVLEGQTGSAGTSSKYARADHVHAFDGQVAKSFVVLESFQYWKIIKKLQSSYNWIQVPKKETATPDAFTQYSIGGAVKSYDPTDNDEVREALEKSLGLTITSDNVVYGISDIPSIINPEYHEFVFDGIIKIVPSTAPTQKIDVDILQPSSPLSVSVIRCKNEYVLLWYRYYNSSPYHVAFVADRDGKIKGGVYSIKSRLWSTTNVYPLSDLRDGTMWHSECYVTDYVDVTHTNRDFQTIAIDVLKSNSMLTNMDVIHQYAAFYPNLQNGIPLGDSGKSTRVAREDHSHPNYATVTGLNVVKTDVGNLKTDVKALKENVAIDDVVVMESSGWLKIYKIKPSSSEYFEKDILVIRANGSIVIRTFGNTGTSSDTEVEASSHNTYKTIIQKFFGIEITQDTTYTIRVKHDCPSDLINAALNAPSGQQTGCYVNFIDSLKDYEIYNDVVLTLNVYTSSYKVLISPYATYAPNYQYEKKDTASWTMALVGINKSGGSTAVPAEDIAALSNGDIPRGAAIIAINGSRYVTVITSDQIFRSISMSDMNNNLSATNSIWYNVANSMGVLYVGEYADGKVTGSVLANKSLWTSELPTTTSGINRSVLFKGRWGDVYGTNLNNLSQYHIDPSGVSIPMNANRDATIRCTYDKSTKKWTNKIVIDESVRAVNIATSKANEVKSLIRIPKYDFIQVNNGNSISWGSVNMCHLHFRMTSNAIYQKAVSGNGCTFVIDPDYLATADTSGMPINMKLKYAYIMPINASIIMYRTVKIHNVPKISDCVSMPILSTGCHVTFNYQCWASMWTVNGLCHPDVANSDAFKNPAYVDICGVFMIAS